MENHVISQNPLDRLAMSIDVRHEPDSAYKIEDLLHADESGSEIFGG